MKPPYRVLHVISALSTGGVQHQLAKVVSAYDRRSFSPAVCCISEKGKIGEELERAGIEVRVLGGRGSGFGLRSLWRLYQLLRSDPVTVIRPHKYRSALYGVIAGRMAKVPVIVPSFHLPQAARKPRRRLMIRLLSLLSDRVIAVSQAVADNLTREMGIPPRKVRVIHNGVDLDDFTDLPSKEEVRERLGIPSGNWVIGAAGRMKRQKGFEYLLKALPLLEEEGLRDYWVMMVGDGPMRPILERQAIEMGCKDKVKFLGFRRDVPQLLRAMDLFAFPSLWEGFGTALVEAMVAEVPVVASDLPCVREIIPDERYGLLVSPRDAEALAAGILRVWRDGETKASLVAAAKDRAVQLFSLGRVVETYQGLFHEILAQKKAGGLP